MSVDYLIENEPDDTEVGDQCEFDTPDGPCPNDPLWKVTVVVYADDAEVDWDGRDACTYHAEQVMRELIPEDDQS